MVLNGAADNRMALSRIMNVCGSRFLFDDFFVKMQIKAHGSRLGINRQHVVSSHGMQGEELYCSVKGANAKIASALNVSSLRALVPDVDLVLGFRVPDCLFQGSDPNPVKDRGDETPELLKKLKKKNGGKRRLSAFFISDFVRRAFRRQPT